MDANTCFKLALGFRRASRKSSMQLRADLVTEQQKVAVVGEDGRARWQYVEGGRIVFKGGKSGEHSLDILASSPERVQAHWEGYCEANGLLKPSVGQWVSFPSASASAAMGGLRNGKVVKVGSKRAVIEFTYKHGGRGVAKVAINEIKF